MVCFEAFFGAEFLKKVESRSEFILQQLELQYNKKTPHSAKNTENKHPNIQIKYQENL